jgi:hypothetical protein
MAIRRSAFTFSFFAFILSMQFAASQTPNDFALCRTPQSHDEGIAACTRLIDSGKLVGPLLGVAHGFRGIAFELKREYAHAIADYRKALQFHPGAQDAKSALRWLEVKTAFQAHTNPPPIPTRTPDIRLLCPSAITGLLPVTFSVWLTEKSCTRRPVVSETPAVERCQFTADIVAFENVTGREIVDRESWKISSLAASGESKSGSCVVLE